MMEQELNHTAAVDVSALVAAGHSPAGRGASGAENQVIAGYTLEARLGAGGYGEVWRATGPGGLAKAVKILHGRYDGPQADTELRSLQKIRDLRHPFILNIERIEIVADRLVIVSELAEKSLEDRFTEAQQHGRGIPRDELLGYLRDAAEALDFMSDSLGLQHLDVKPGNLLLQGRHVKVADFGLIKDVQRNDLSLVSGYTPLYAAPEVFEGRPEPNSDQYSLAMVFHAMLCGAAPFNGRNAAQLMAQHLSSKPDLSALPPSDRPAVARALSKMPGARYPHCRSFIESLEKARSSAARARPRSSAPAEPDEASVGTAPSAPGVHDTAVVHWRDASPLPPLELGDSSGPHTPVLFVGIGGLAGRALAYLRGRTAEAFGPTVDLPSLPVLYLDSDPHALEAACEGRSGRALRPEETLHLALRDPNAYRRGPAQAGEWLSRRWLFNIPKSKRIEGMRPLGRLVFIDHIQEVRQRIADVLRRALRPESLEATATATGLALDCSAPEVYLVASLSGGSGSGCVLDAGYMVRSVLKELGFDGASVTGLLLHATGARGDLAEVQRANTFCCLREFERFTSGAGYPGDPACGLRPTGEPPFGHTYVLHLGDSCSESQFDLQARNVGEYLFRATATPAREFAREHLHDCARRSEVSADPGAVGVLGIGVLGGAGRVEAAVDADALCRAVVARWLRRPEASPEDRSGQRPNLPEDRSGQRANPPADPTAIDEARSQTVALLEKLRLTGDLLTARAMEILGGNDVKRLEAYFRNRLPQIIGCAPAGEGRAAAALRAIEQHFFDEPPAGSPGDHPAALLAAYRAKFTKEECAAADALARHFLKVAETAERHVHAAQDVLADTMSRLAALSTRLQEFARDVERDCRNLVSAGNASVNLNDRCLNYARLCFCKFVFQLLAEFVVDLRQRTKEINGVLLRIRMRLEELENHMARSGGGKLLPDPATVEAFDRSLRRGGWVRFLTLIEHESLDVFWDKLREATAEFFLGGAGAPGSSGSACEPSAAYVERCEEQAVPGFSGVGGHRRVLAVLPDGMSEASWRQRLTRRFGDCVTVQPGASGRVVVLCDVQGLHVDELAAVLGAGQRLREMADRLHTRIDVDWR